ncbi:TonB-dependent receptor plug domain-containing protein [Pelagicoccus mobilis]|uniref:TonB-dependent receptor n=1 Tax=Pelagicoccus mobilis TaxID=415221 RepID=A0A934VRR0_9BACT|nr:TonB-dependent receptor plug domain-containing protein [Pelagicoccus mobilis]MBK1879667.1 TonB-dependent receptor [Pelagicoccus mobilis]
MKNETRYNKRYCLRKWSLVSAALFGALQIGYAQDEEEEIFELSPFTVDGSQDEGYRASQTLAGGRTATNIKDVGTSIEVITKDFLDDVGASNVEEFLQYTTGGEVGGSQGNFVGHSAGGQDGQADNTSARRAPHQNTRLRGIGRPDYVRNYYKTNIPMESYNTDRVDINRGANSMLFGLGSPAGLINTGYQRANFSNTSRVDVDVDSEGSFRTALNFNRELIEGKLAVRMAALVNNKTYRQDPSYRDDNRYFGAITYRPFENTTFRAHFEDGDIMGNAPDTLLPTQAFDSFIKYRTPVDLFYNVQHFGDSEGPDQAQWDALYAEDPAAAAQFVNRDSAQGSVLSNGSMWGYAMVYDGANGGNPSFGFQPEIANNQYETNGDLPGDPFWDPAVLADGSPGGMADGAVQMMFYRNARLEDDRPVGGPAQGFTSLDGFDFSRRNFGGNTDFYSHDFQTYNLSLEQIFWDGQAGVEIGFDRETMNNDAITNFNGWKGEFLIDINKTLPLPALNADGSFKTDLDGNVVSEAMPNPNYGRPLYVTEPNRSTSFEERETIRATAFVKYDFEEKHSDSFLKWLGSHTMTALGDEYTERFRTAHTSHQTYSNDFNLGWQVGTSNGDDPASGYRRTSKMIYMGPALQTYIDDPFNPNTPININDIIIDASGANLLDHNPVARTTFWNLGPDAEGSNWMTTGYSEAEREVLFPETNYGDPPSNHYGTEPDWYTGDRREYWDIGHVDSRWTPTNNNSTRETVVESWAINLQSMFFNNHLVTNLGYREDVVENWLNTLAQEKHDLALAGQLSDSYLGDRTLMIDPEYFYANDPERAIFTEIDKGPSGDGSFGYGGVLHMPKDLGIFSLPDGTGLSFHYNFSKNFVPDASRNTFVTGSDYSFEALSSPIGEGEDVGFTVSLNENKLVARFNWFQSSIENNTAAGLGNTLNQLVNWGIRARHWALQDIASDDPDGNGIIDVNANGGAHPRAGNDRFDISRTYNVLEATQFIVDDGWEQGKLDNGLLVMRPNGIQQFQQWYPGLEDTEDRVAKGYEANITYNPTRNWRIAINATQLKSISSNVGPLTEKLMNSFFPHYNTIKDYTLWQSHDTNGGAPFSRWFEPHVMSYFQKKLQEGSSTNEVREWSANFVTNYKFTEGKFKGFSVGGAVRWQSSGAIGYPLMDYEVSPGVVLEVPDVSRPWKGDDALYVDLHAGFSKKIMDDKVRYNARVHLKNINNHGSDNLTTVRANFDGTASTVRWDPPFLVQFSNSFEF